MVAHAILGRRGRYFTKSGTTSLACVG